MPLPGDASKQLMVGRSIYDWYIREWAGVDPATGAAMWYRDTYEVDGWWKYRI